jgi:hypothetical protein
VDGSCESMHWRGTSPARHRSNEMPLRDGGCGHLARRAGCPTFRLPMRAIAVEIVLGNYKN